MRRCARSVNKKCISFSVLETQQGVCRQSQFGLIWIVVYRLYQHECNALHIAHLILIGGSMVIQQYLHRLALADIVSMHSGHVVGGKKNADSLDTALQQSAHCMACEGQYTAISL